MDSALNALLQTTTGKALAGVCLLLAIAFGGLWFFKSQSDAGPRKGSHNDGWDEFADTIDLEFIWDPSEPPENARMAGQFRGIHISVENLSVDGGPPKTRMRLSSNPPSARTDESEWEKLSPASLQPAVQRDLEGLRGQAKAGPGKAEVWLVGVGSQRELATALRIGQAMLSSESTSA